MSPAFESQRSTETRRKKVVRIIARLNIGGPAIQACYLHTALRPQFQTVLITGKLDTGEGDMSYLLKSRDGVAWLDAMSRPVRFGLDFISFLRLVRLLRRERPDLVHTHTAKAGTLGRIAAKIAGVPVVVHTFHGHIFRGDYFGPAVTKAFLFIERVLARYTDALVTVSTSQARELSCEFRIAPADKFRVIHNGYDLAPFADRDTRETTRKAWGISDNDVLIVWAGRMVPVKNVELLAAVIRQVSLQSRLRFIVVGDGPEREKLESLTNNCQNVRSIGWSTDMPRVWAAADIALVTSKNEGTPSALIEAMAAGVPFVATAVGGVRDLVVGDSKSSNSSVQEFDNGYLLDASPATFASVLLKLADDPGSRHRKGAVGRKFAFETFSQERLASDMADLYEQLLSRVRKHQNTAPAT